MTAPTAKNGKTADLQHVKPGHWVAYSSRDPEVWYHLTREADGRGHFHWVCSCPGFINYHHCYHHSTLMGILRAHRGGQS